MEELSVVMNEKAWRMDLEERQEFPLFLFNEIMGLGAEGGGSVALWNRGKACTREKAEFEELDCKIAAQILERTLRMQ